MVGSAGLEQGEEVLGGFYGIRVIDREVERGFSVPP